MRRYLIAASVLGIALSLGAEPSHAGNDGEQGSESAFPWDDGPDSIDVSKYPPEQQASYAVFERKCSRCHTLARAINSPIALPEEWERYLRSKAERKRRSGLDRKSVDRIIGFLQYDSSVRKKELIEKKINEKQK